MSLVSGSPEMMRVGVAEEETYLLDKCVLGEDLRFADLSMFTDWLSG